MWGVYTGHFLLIHQMLISFFKRKKWSYMQTVGDIFLTFVEFFRGPYKQFIMRFSEVSQAIDICAKRSGVEAFFTV